MNAHAPVTIHPDTRGPSASVLERDSTHAGRPRKGARSRAFVPL
jgi:hypothetical protein